MSEQYYDYLTEADFRLISGDNFYLSESDFYPPSDSRVWKSYVEDIDGGDNFADYCEYIFKIYEDEGYYD